MIYSFGSVRHLIARDKLEDYKSPNLYLRTCTLILGIVARIHLEEGPALMNALKIVIEIVGPLCLTVRQADPPILDMAQATMVGLADQK